jgi:hypothetical protein
VESQCEYLDLELVGVHPAQAVAEGLAAALPPGLALGEAKVIDPRTPSISASLRAVHYVAEFPAVWSQADLEEAVRAFEDAGQAIVHRAAPAGVGGRKRGEKIARNKAREIDLKAIVTHLALEGERRVAFSLRADPSGSAKPAEVLAAIFGEGVPPRGVRVLKEGVSFERTRGNHQPATQPRAPRYLDA